AKRIERIAKEMAEQKPAFAIAGGPALAHTNATFTAAAGNALNEGLGQTSGSQSAVRQSTVNQASVRQSSGSHTAVASLGDAKVLLIDDANPVYTSPTAWKVKDALGKIPYIASFGSFVDDTSAYADLILPDHSFLESWVDRTAVSGPMEAPAMV